MVNYIGGASAGLLTRTILYPLEYTRNRMNNQIKGEKSILGCLKEAYCREGLRGIYRGAMVSFVGVAVFRSTYFGIYDTFKEKTETALQRWAVSYLSVFAAISLTYPSDTVRRRMMLTSCADYKYKNFVDCARQIWTKEGSLGFYSGAPMILLQSATGATIYFIFDKIIKDLKTLE